MKTEAEISAALDRLTELESAIDNMRLTMHAQIDAVMTDAQRAQVADIKIEFEPAIEGAVGDVAMLREQIKDAVIARGITIKGARLSAQYVRGRVSWDGKALDGYMAAHPEIVKFRTEGEPSVRLVNNK